VEFADFARQPDERLDLLQGALLIAKDAYPALDVVEQISRIDELARPIGERGLPGLAARAQARAISDHLYVALGFRGNEADYYDPKNSFLNDVLDRKTGIPISLAVLYIEVARRAGVYARGISFPGHFLVRVEDARGGPAAIVDPFFRGSVLGPNELSEVKRRASEQSGAQSTSLEPAPTRQVLLRMLANLRSIYAGRGDFRALLLVLDRMLDLAPNAAAELRDRGLLTARLGAPRAAIDDLTRYVSSAPNAGDVAEVRRIIGELERSLSPSAN
jgi:regulator of sirC expression with transglutaminase-like and TPR domain